MGDGGDHLADRCQPLRPDELGLNRLTVCS
jgi:hypothetical protein